MSHRYSIATDTAGWSRSVIPVVYIKTTVDQWSEKWQSKHNYICKYNNLPTTCFGRDWPSSGWDTTSEELYIVSIGMGDEISFTNIWGLWPNRCRNKHVSVWNVHLLGGGLAGLGLEALVAGCHNGGLGWLLYVRCCGGGNPFPCWKIRWAPGLDVKCGLV